MTARDTPVRLGLSAYDLPMSDFVELARDADRAGVDSLWLGEHVFHPKEYSSEHPGSHKTQHHAGPIVQERTHLLDPFVTLAAAAAVTERIRLATGIFVLPLRDPLLVARAVASLDELSEGRFVLGTGAGWLREEFDALGIDFGTRGRRLREAVQVLKLALAGGFVEHHGDVFDFEALQVCEQPAHVPIIMGGNSDIALKRAARLGDGWFSSGSLSVDEASQIRTHLLGLLASNGRSEESFEIVVRPEVAGPDEVAAWAAAGFRHIIVWADGVWTGDTASERRESLELSMAALRAASI